MIDEGFKAAQNDGFNVLLKRFSRSEYESLFLAKIDHDKIVKTVKSTGAVVTGPIPLPTHKKLFTVLRSPHVNKKAREQFQLSSYKRLLDIYSSSSKTIDALMKLELPSGVEVEIKV